MVKHTHDDRGGDEDFAYFSQLRDDGSGADRPGGVGEAGPGAAGPSAGSAAADGPGPGGPGVEGLADDPEAIPRAPEGLSLPRASDDPPGAVVGPGGPLTADLPVPPAMAYAAGPPVGANEAARERATTGRGQARSAGPAPAGTASVGTAAAGASAAIPAAAVPAAAVPATAGPGAPGSGGVTTTQLWPEAGSAATDVAVASTATVTHPSGHGEWISCPECGESAMVDLAQRRSEDFCRKCDFPLFWARGAVVPLSGEETGASLRRLPGTVGRAATASVACPHCGEPNSPTAIICIRCSLPMVIAQPEPEPEPEPVYVPEPEPEPEPEPGFPWGWVIAACAFIVIVTVVVAWIALS